MAGSAVERTLVALCAALCARAGIAQPVTADARSGERDEVETIVVTGTRLVSSRLAVEQSFQQVRSYDRARIDSSGQSTVTDFLATLPEVSINSLESTYGATSVRLRGAREGSTLILINGRRTQASTGAAALIGFFDLNTIPLSMVERVDVLPTGSSAIYGGEALAGVVNIVLKSEFEGAEASVGYKSSSDTHERTISGGWGWHGERASVSLLATYTDRSALSGSERELTSSGDFRRYGGPNLGSVFFGTPATILSVSGNLPGLNASVAGVPDGSTGVGLTPQSFAATAGVQHLGTFNSYQDLVRPTQRKGFLLNAEYRLGGATELFAELLASDFDDALAATTPFALQQTTVPASNAFNPFGAAVRASGVVLGAERLARFTFQDELVRPLVGARGRLGEWDWEVTGLDSRDRGGQYIYGQPNTTRLTAALASADPSEALNPFVDGPMASAALLASIFSDANLTDWRGDSTVVNGFVRSSVATLPAGTLDLVVGSEYEKSALTRGVSAERHARAAFMELRAPVLAARDSRREVLALHAAARNDDYSDFGTEGTWQLGLEYRPLESLLVRGTRGTAFKPPTLYSLAAPFSSAGLPIIDPLRNRETVVAQSMTSGNPQLDPTTGTSNALGVTWSARSAAQLVVSVTAWTLDIDGTVTLPGAQFIVDNESLYPGRVTRGPAAAGQVGSIVSVDRSYINFGAIRERGIDASVAWQVETAAGALSPSFAATYMTEFEGATVPGGPNVNRLSRANSDGIFAPRMKATAAVGWQPSPALNLSFAGRYVGHYYDYTPTRRLGNHWYADASVNLALGAMANVSRGALAGLDLVVSATNLTDKQPPYSTHFRGYDIYNYDLLGRTLFVRVRKGF